MFSQFIYDNNYMWEFPFCYRLAGNNYVYDVFYAGEAGRLRDWGMNYDLNISTLLLDWDIYDETALSFMKKLNLNDLSIDEVNKFIRDSLDNAEKKLSLREK